MAKKPDKIPKPKKMTAKEQSARFIATARELEADETGEKLDEFVRAIAAAKSK